MVPDLQEEVKMFIEQDIIATKSYKSFKMAKLLDLNETVCLCHTTSSTCHLNERTNLTDLTFC